MGRICVSEIWGAYFRDGIFWGGLIIGILRYNSLPRPNIRESQQVYFNRA